MGPMKRLLMQAASLRGMFTMGSNSWLPGSRLRRVDGARGRSLQVELLETRLLLSSSNVVELEPNDTLATANAVPLGFDAGEDTRVIVKGTVSPQGDHDWFSVELNKGDVISASVRDQNRLDPTVRFVGSEGTLVYSDNTACRGRWCLPPESPLSWLGSRKDWYDSEFYYVVNTSGRYFIEIAASPNAPPDWATGDYHMELVAARPGLEAQPVGTKQVLFIDFDGATVNMSDFGHGLSHATTGIQRLSPLSSFLGNWGLTPADENAVIDATLAAIREKLSEDIRARGLNGDYASSGVPGEFDIEIRNSRDDPDEFGKDPFVSRIVIGGTKEELDAPWIFVAVSEVIDPGNFSFDDEAIVLLDDLSAPAESEFSFNQYAIAEGHTKAELVGLGLGSLAAHEAGHFFGNFHTELTEPDSDRFDLMDGDPYSLDLTVGVGPDRVFGTSDDIDVHFGVDVYNNWGAFRGRQDTLNTIAFGLSTGRGIRASATSGSAIGVATASSNNATTDYATLAAAAATFSSERSWGLARVDAFFADLARTTEQNKTPKKAALEPESDLMLYDPPAVL